MGADQRLEAGPLVAARKPVQDDGVLPDVGVHVQEGRAARQADLAQGARRHQHPVADAAHLEQNLGGLAAPPDPVQDHPSQRTDHGVPFPLAAVAARSPAPDRWQTARARASARSAGRGGCVQAEQHLHHALHLLLGRRAVTGDGELDLVGAVLRRPDIRPGRPPPAPVRCAWPTDIAVRALTWNRTRSTTTTSGRRSASNRVRSSHSAPSRSLKGSWVGSSGARRPPR